MGFGNKSWPTPEEKTMPCTTCGRATHFTGTQKCHNCWEVEKRLEFYLEGGGDNATTFVVQTLHEVSERIERRKNL